MRALSVRQPFAEQILRGIKTVEYRSRPTNIRERVYIYASRQPAAHEVFAKMQMEPADLPQGLIVGSVEVVGCTESSGGFRWHLAMPKRLARPLRPKNRPQPVWFNPF